jgi:hypothetical protein
MIFEEYQLSHATTGFYVKKEPRIFSSDFARPLFRKRLVRSAMSVRYRRIVRACADMPCTLPSCISNSLHSVGLLSVLVCPARSVCSDLEGPALGIMRSQCCAISVSLDEAKKAAEVLINSIVITTALSPGGGLTVVWLARLFTWVTA